MMSSWGVYRKLCGQDMWPKPPVEEEEEDDIANQRFIDWNHINDLIAADAAADDADDDDDDAVDDDNDADAVDDDDDDETAELMRDPVKYSILKDPVVLNDGFTYSRDVVDRWFVACSKHSLLMQVTSVKRMWKCWNSTNEWMKRTLPPVG